MLEGAISNTSRVVQFASGDLLVLVTDGVFEWPDPKREQFGIERLKNVIAEHANLDPESLIEEIYRQDTKHASGSQQTDDLTMMNVKCTQ